MVKTAIFKSFLSLSLVVLLSVVVGSCANQGTPNGGPYDELPPRMVSSHPQLHQTNYEGKKIEILFDELIKLDNPSENVIITPPQKNQPIIRAMGRKIAVELKDSMLPDITYTLDFTNSIGDNNEDNRLENFSFAFSTGDVLDTLEISGVLLNAFNLEPMPGILVGLHRDLADSAFTSLPFYRTSKSNDRGQFIIRNIEHGSYRLYALNDANRNYLFDQPGEAIAFCDTIITPYFEFSTRQDTIWKDTLTIDSIRAVDYTHFLPDDVVLRLFQEPFHRQLMLRPTRSEEHLFSLKFNHPLDSLPTLLLLEEESIESWAVPQLSDDKVEVHYWITDSLVSKRDTIHLEVHYMKSDSLNRLLPQIDTLHLSAPKRRGAATKKKEEEERQIFLAFQTNLSRSMNLYDTVSIEFAEPLSALGKEAIVLERQQDTLFLDVEFALQQDSLNPLRYQLIREWHYGEQYRLSIDSARIYSLYGKWNDAFQTQFAMKEEDQYGHLQLSIEGVTAPAFVELLNGNDEPVRMAKVVEGVAQFDNLLPAKYYVRLIKDDHENMQWDPGDYGAKRQPEDVFYSTRFFDVKANWRVDEVWDVLAVPLNQQKPKEITKNKPKDVTKRKRNYKEEGQSKSGRSGGFGGLGGLGGGRSF